MSDCSRLPLELLCSQALANRDAELLGIDGSPSCSPSDEGHMFVILRTQSGKLFCNAGAIGEEAGRLQNGSELAADASNPADHAKLAHVCLYSLYAIMSKEVADSEKGSTYGHFNLLGLSSVEPAAAMQSICSHGWNP